jgi:hypothetical protein
MSSLTTSSDDEIGWRRCLVACLGALGISAVLLFAALLLIDPYDSGRGWLGIDGVDDRDTHTATASRARDARFDSAIIGNSTAQLLNPADLSQSTGLRFVQLYLTGGSPREQLAVLDFFLRHHPRVGALVFVTDPFWCAHRRAETRPGDFPYWLYGTSTLDWAARLMSRESIEHAFQRISIGFGLRQRNPPDGFFSYEDIWPPGQFRETNRPRDPAPVEAQADRDFFPEIAELDVAIKKLPADVAAIVVVPPTLATTVARPGTAAAAERDACNAALAKTVAGRPRSNFLNYRVDNSQTRDQANFADFIHYRPSLAGRMTSGIAESVRLGNAAKVAF